MNNTQKSDSSTCSTHNAVEVDADDDHHGTTVQQLDLNDHNSKSSSNDEDNGSHFRNPSPPPSDVILGDAISGTAVSERWILQTLMKLAKAVDDDDVNKNRNGDRVCELDDDLETNLCQLWDVSVEKEVVLFLLTVPTVNIFTDALSCATRFPRLAEIVVGVCGNMACIDEACDVLLRNDVFCRSLVAALDSHDPPTLAELFRVYLAFLQNESSRSLWLKHIHTDQNFLPRLTFITSSSTNDSLLKAIAGFVDFALEVNDDFCTLWASNDFVLALLEAIRQIGFNDNVKLVDTFYHVLHSLSTSDKGKETTMGLREIIVESVSSHLRNTFDDDLIDAEARAVGIASSLALVQMLLTTDPNSTMQLLEEGGVIASLLKLLNQLFANSDSTASADGSRSSDRVNLEDCVRALIEDISSFDEGITLLLRTLNECKESNVIESLHSLMKISADQVIDRLRSAIPARQTSLHLDRLNDILKRFES